MGSLLTLVNTVADEAAAAHPGRLVSTLAYAYSAPPPRSLRPRDNVLITWCSIDACFIHAFDDPACPDNAAQYAQLKAWSRIAPNLHVWDYYMNHDRRGSSCPCPTCGGSTGTCAPRSSSACGACSPRPSAAPTATSSRACGTTC